MLAIYQILRLRPLNLSGIFSLKKTCHHCLLFQAYVTCALGIHYVGYAMICFSAVNSLCSLLFGKISQFTGRKLLFALGM